MKRLATICGALLLCVRAAWADEPVDYLKQVKPILAGKCFACHGALRQQRGLRLDAAQLLRKGSNRGPVIVPGNAAESLLIRKVSAEDPAQRMPPKGKGEPLTAAQIAVLRAWIDQGAAAADEAIPSNPRSHWAYQPPVRPKIPDAGDASWVRDPIDALLAARQREHGVGAAAEAPREVLLRRVYLDLIGLPPTREELLAFLADRSPDAYEKVVDHLLESPLYGERWARHWMDVWRYSDWTGFGNEIRYSQRYIWRWRDWIVESLNADKGYDRMILEMLAADELAPGDDDAGRALGFLARNWYKFDRDSWLDDTIEHTGKAFLATTIKCARCHDHKYDPIAQTEYYRFRAIFEPYDVRTDRRPGELDVDKDGLVRVYDAQPEAATYLFVRGDPKRPDKEREMAPGVPAVLGGPDLDAHAVSLPLSRYYPALRPFVVRELVAAQRADVAKAAAVLVSAHEQFAQGDGQRAAEGSSAGPSQADEDVLALAEKNLAAALARLSALQARVAAEEAKYAAAAEKQADIESLARTAAKAVRQAAVAEAEANLLAAEQQHDRAEKALRSDDAKLQKALGEATKKLEAARKSLEEAKKNAEQNDASYEPLGPTYPKTSTGRRLALARWIVDRHNPLTARVAVNHMWMRHFGEPLVEDVVDFGLRSPRPLHADVLDYLAVEFMQSGWSMKALHRLIVTSGAYRMSSRPADAPAENVKADPDNKLLWRSNARRMEAEVVRDAVLYVGGSLDRAMGGPDIDHNRGLTVPRRSVYFQHARERQVPFLELFDAANPRECYRRRQSVRPQQAFALVNSSLTLAQSRLLARRLSDDLAREQPGASADDAFIRTAFVTVLSRRPTAEELAACCEFLEKQSEQLAHPEKLELLADTADAVAPAADPHQRARENLVLVLFNHNDFVTIR